jgi:hypothetical protein
MDAMTGVCMTEIPENEEDYALDAEYAHQAV